MTQWPWLLALDDVVVIGGALLFLITKQRIYTIMAAIIIVLLLLTNFIMFQGYHSWLVLAIPFIALNAITLFGRWLLPHPVVINSNIRTTHIWRNFIILLIVVGLLLLLLSLIFIFLVSKP